MANFDPVYTPFSVAEAAKIVCEDPDVCVADRQRGALLANLTWGDRHISDLAAHSFVDIVEYGLNQQLNKATGISSITRRSIAVGLDWICSLEEDWECVSFQNFFYENIDYLDCELREEPHEYSFVSSTLGSVRHQAYAAFILNYWFCCMIRCNNLLVGQLTLGLEYNIAVEYAKKVKFGSHLPYVLASRTVAA